MSHVRFLCHTMVVICAFPVENYLYVAQLYFQSNLKLYFGVYICKIATKKSPEKKRIKVKNSSIADVDIAQKIPVGLLLSLENRAVMELPNRMAAKTSKAK